MAQLCLYLPPFSPDYSGAGAMLFDLNALTVMHDAGGCTGNYTGHDEPRWYDSKATVFCSGLRMIDAIMGNDQKLKDNVCAAIKTLNPEFVALVGSPVPMVIGMDLKGLAHEIESETGIPAIGIETTGTDYYDAGAFKAAKALLDKFCPPETTITPPSATDADTYELSGTLHYNILGATPLDYERTEDLDHLQDVLNRSGFSLIARPGYGYDLRQLRNMGQANVNIAVSHAGFLTAKYMEKKYGIPYLCGVPLGEKNLDLYAERLKEVALSRESEMFFSESFPDTPASTIKAYSGKCTGSHKETCSCRKTGSCGKTDSCGDKMNALIIGDQIISESLKHYFRDHLEVTVGCIFTPDRDIPSSSVLNLKNEKEIKKALCDERYSVIIADPLFEKLLPKNHKKLFLPLPQYAVSGDIYHKDAKPFLGKYFDDLLRNSPHTSYKSYKP
ncbi:nitrogenase molybdenum-iron protein, alpha and beta chain [Lachnospiraceae bacterium JC7]|nr:nitrogenase molybdenum-iron protein, alpha and beta chain [Lachnospiraceae bacterium JC7]